MVRTYTLSPRTNRAPKDTTKFYIFPKHDGCFVSAKLKIYRQVILWSRVVWNANAYLKIEYYFVRTSNWYLGLNNLPIAFLIELHIFIFSVGPRASGASSGSNVKCMWLRVEPTDAMRGINRRETDRTPIILEIKYTGWIYLSLLILFFFLYEFVTTQRRAEIGKKWFVEP